MVKNSKGITISSSRLSELIVAETTLKAFEDRLAVAPLEQELQDLVFGVLRKTPLEKWPKVAREAFESLTKTRYQEAGQIYRSKLPTYTIPNDIRKAKTST